MESRKRSPNKTINLRVVHGPVNVGNQPWILSRYERKLGCKSDLVVNYSTWLKYNADRCLSQYRSKTWQTILKRCWFSLTAPFKYHILHFYFGRSFMCWDDFGPPNSFWFSDLKLAKHLGRRVFMTLQGCDTRLARETDVRQQVTMCRQGFCQAYATCAAVLDEERKKLISDILPLADRVFYLNPDLGHFLPVGTFMPYASVDVENIEPIPPRTHGPIRIVHAPSDPHIKGSSLIQQAVDSIKDRYSIEFIQIQNLTHDEAFKVYSTADLAIDQLLAGWYGGFAVEMMALGKPVVCYIQEKDLCFIPETMKAELPILNVTRDDLQSQLIEIINQRSLWPEWSHKSRRYVLKWHNPRHIARALIKAYRSPNSEFDLQQFLVGS
jgi:glycosyltransferase involved in cell wall biosynthesis